jgi:hypothetical protein
MDERGGERERQMLIEQMVWAKARLVREYMGERVGVDETHDS